MWFTPFSSHFARQTVALMLAFKYQDGVSNQQEKQRRPSDRFTAILRSS